MLNSTHSALVNSWLKDEKTRIPVEKESIIPGPSGELVQSGLKSLINDILGQTDSIFLEIVPFKLHSGLECVNFPRQLCEAT